MIEDLIADIKAIANITPKAAAEYGEKRKMLVDAVNRALTAQPAISKLIGNNPLDVMYNNHDNHAHFMSTVFSLNQYELLVRTVPWVYRAYHARGFSHDYFPLALAEWSRATEQHLRREHAEQILTVYRWMISRHADMIVLSRQEPDEAPADPRWKAAREQLEASLLSGDTAEAMAVAKTFVHRAADLKDFFLQVIQPVMYEIGRKWEHGKISVAQEHLASSIIGRTMAALYMNFAATKPTKKRAVVTSAPNEYHELGAWMVADLLEMDGWDVRYLGANTPPADLLNMIADVRPAVLALSVTMSFNLVRVKQLIADVRRASPHGAIKIMVGGTVFNTITEAWREIGADGFARDAQDAVVLARTWS